MATKAAQFIIGCFMLFISFLMIKVDCFVFGMMVDMLRERLELSAYNVTMLLGLFSLFSILTLVIIVPASCSVYMILDVFDIVDVSKEK